MPNRSTPRSRAAARYANALSHVRHSSSAARRARTANARAALASIFTAAADPKGNLRPAEVQRRAEYLRKGWYQSLAWARRSGHKPMPLRQWLARYARWDDEAAP